MAFVQMSNYYKYEFTSPEPIYALIKQELRSYFNTGAVDGLLFPIWTDKCLKKFGKSSYKIEEQFLKISSSSARLPDDFKSVKEAWLITSVSRSRQLPQAHYLQTISRLDEPDVFCQRCAECENPDIIKAIYKSTMQVAEEFKREHLLRPGNIRVQTEFCAPGCLNIGSTSPDIFDIRDNKIIVNFTSGDLYLVYYSKQTDEKGFQLVPDNYRIKEYIEAFIKFKLFEQMCNQVTDETYKQIEGKKQEYERKSDEAFIIAETETKKKTVEQIHQAILRTQHRLDKYIIR